MISQFFRFTGRVLFRHPLYTVITVTGLAIGLAIAQVGLSYVVREFRWEDCHKNHDRIYRVELTYRNMDTTLTSARVMAPLGPAIVSEMPDVQQAAVFRHLRNAHLTLGQKSHLAGPLLFAGPAFFEVFTFPLKVGSPESCLNTPYAVLITDSLAEELFPGENPVGKTIGLVDSTLYTITGVLEDPPLLTQLHCDLIASYSSLVASGGSLDSWTADYSDFTYLLLRDGTDRAALANRIQALFANHVTRATASHYSFSLQSLKDVYCNSYYSGNEGELYPGREYDMLIFIISVCLFILLQAIVNFVSLATARAADRHREIGVRKTLGADRKSLILQFLGESMLLTCVATLLSAAMLELLRTGYHTITPDPYNLVNLYTEPASVFLVVLLATAVGLLAGYYPALYLSRYQPTAALRGRVVVGRSRWTIRKSLLVFQFTLAVFFATVTLGLQDQLRFLTHYDLGFERDNMLVMQFAGENGPRNCTVMQQELQTCPEALSTARSNRIMGTRFLSMLYFSSANREENEIHVAKHLVGDYDFLSHYGITLVKGRAFTSDQPGDIDRGILINESFAKELGFSEPIGSLLFTDSSFREIIGVVRDFQGSALDFSYHPGATISLNPDKCRVLTVKLRPDNISGSIAGIRSVWNRVFPNQPFVYSFLDENIRTAYGKLDNESQFFGILTIISLLIAGLGVFGLVSYTVTCKTKEIAIRKVMGASTSVVQSMLTREFMVLIGLATVVAFPLAYWVNALSREEYPVRAPFDITVYVAGGLLTAVIALATCAYHVIKASRANPADALRNE